MKMSDFPIEATNSIPTVEIKGDCEVYVTGCLGILEYERDMIVVEGIGRKIEILGEGLEISEFLASGICAAGTVNEVKITRLA